VRGTIGPRSKDLACCGRPRTGSRRALLMDVMYRRWGCSTSTSSTTTSPTAGTDQANIWRRELPRIWNDLPGNCQAFRLTGAPGDRQQPDHHQPARGAGAHRDGQPPLAFDTFRDRRNSNRPIVATSGAGSTDVGCSIVALNSPLMVRQLRR